MQVDQIMPHGELATPYEVRVSNGRRVRHIKIGHSYALIGRSARSAIQLTGSRISYRHAALQLINDRLFCIDLCRACGTGWAEGPAPGEWLTPDHGVQIGRHSIELVEGFDPTCADPPENFNPLQRYRGEFGALPLVEMRLLDDSIEHEPWQIERLVTLFGRAPGCKIRLNSRNISKVQFYTVLTPEGLCAVDTLGKGGLRVNRRPVDSVLLADGDIFRVSRYRIQIKYLKGQLFGSMDGRPPAEAAPVLPDFYNVITDDSDAGSSASIDALEIGADRTMEEPGRALLRSAVGSGALSQADADRFTKQRGDAIPDVGQLTKSLVDDGLLTPWQLKRITGGQKHQLVLEQRYRLIAPLGCGGMGKVYRGLDLHNNRVVAIKLPHRRFAQDARGVLRFQREIKIGRMLNHPNIVRTLDVADDGTFFVLEYVEGENLKALVRRSGCLTPLHAVDIIRQVTQGLEAAFRSGVVHRDVKPSNILIDSEGTAKLLDLGLARLQEETEPAMTRIGAQLGTVHYIAPEQAHDSHEADTRCDIYSLGCTLYELLSGHPPFDGAGPVQVLLKHANEAAPPIPQLDPQLDAIITTSLAKDPDDRFQTPNELLIALQAWQIDALKQDLQQSRAQLDATNDQIDANTTF